MAKLNNTGRAPFQLPTGLRLGPGESITVENIDITRPDNWPALQTLRACGDATWDLDAEVLMEAAPGADLGIAGPVQAPMPTEVAAAPEAPEPAEVAATKPAKK